MSPAESIFKYENLDRISKNTNDFTKAVILLKKGILFLYNFVLFMLNSTIMMNLLLTFSSKSELSNSLKS